MRATPASTVSWLQLLEEGTGAGAGAGAAGAGAGAGVDSNPSIAVSTSQLVDEAPDEVCEPTFGPRMWSWMRPKRGHTSPRAHQQHKHSRRRKRSHRRGHKRPLKHAAPHRVPTPATSPPPPQPPIVKRACAGCWDAGSGVLCLASEGGFIVAGCRSGHVGVSASPCMN